MPLYWVQVARYTTSYATVRVRADSRDEAAYRAEEKLESSREKHFTDLDEDNISILDVGAVSEKIREEEDGD